jgi:hypothetical protein
MNKAMKYKHVLYPVTSQGKLRQLLRFYQSDLAFGKTSRDPKEVAEVLLWFDNESAKFKDSTKRVSSLIAALWSQYCRSNG